MKAELFISWRYLATKRKEKFISLISVISILGVAIGVASLIVVLAVMSGFDNDLREKIVGNYSHITISANKLISRQDYAGISGKLAQNSHVQGISPNIQGQLLVKEQNRYFAVSLRGIDPKTEAGVTKISKYLTYGSLENLSDDSIIIGKELAFYLGIGPDSIVQVYSPFGKLYSLKVAGIFNSGMYEYDLNLIFSNLKTAQTLFETGDSFSNVSVKLDNLYLADRVKQDLSGILGFNYNLKTWTEANQNFFAALKLEKLTMFIILTLVILVAAFNIASTLIVLVVEKTKDIGILKAIGMRPGQIRNIFTLEGFIIGSLGTLFGASGGFALCVLLKKYQFIKLPQDIYYIDHLPVSIQLWPDISLIVLAAMAITLFSTIYPAAKAAGLNAVEALKYE